MVAIAADHAGVALKSAVARQLEELGYRVMDLGTNGPESVDYPDYAGAVADAVAGDRAQWGVLVCGSGVGMAIAANRNPSVRAVSAHNALEARLSRQHNDSNVLTLGAQVVGPGLARLIVAAWLDAEYEGGRHAPRLAMIAQLENERAAQGEEARP